MQPGKLYGIGIGPGDPELLTLKGARILAECDVIFTVISQHVSESVSGAVVEAVRPRGRVERLTFSMSRDPAERQAVLAANAQRIADELRAGRSCAYT
ncbi:MAG: precorrin-2 C(20)-methyltransferase, partial [Desulfovibrio sp.]|nr:precorrin-2 C(20)-methyltransferase [Desulfovibrio sp.]